MFSGISKMLVVGIVVACLLTPGIVGYVVTNNSDQRNYQNALASCERANPIRSVIFNNTKALIRQNPEVRTYRESLRTLLASGVNPVTGEVDCRNVVEHP